jgi:histidine phosphotransferase ChpT
LLLLAGQTIPRGGTLKVDPVGAGQTMGFRISAAGQNARVPQAVPGLVAGEPGGNAVDSHAIQPFYTGLLARSCGLAVNLTPEGEGIVVTAA